MGRNLSHGVGSVIAWLLLVAVHPLGSAGLQGPRPARGWSPALRSLTLAGATGGTNGGGQRVGFRLFRCAGEECTEIVDSTERSIVVNRAAAVEQAVLRWSSRPRSVLLVSKPLAFAPDMVDAVIEAVRLLRDDLGLKVVVERDVQSHVQQSHSELGAKLILWSGTTTHALAEKQLADVELLPEPWGGSRPEAEPEGEARPPAVDLVVTLGGDGVLIHVNRIFPRACPPVLSLSGGSLGFLVPFELSDMNRVLPASVAPSVSDEHGGLPLSLRMRLCCRFGPPPHASADGAVGAPDDHSDVTELVVLNEVVIERGPSPYLARLEVSVNGVYLTTIQADGVIFSTPTGSTAYSMSAGGSVVHPAVNAILLTPICPHSLSCRPMLLPHSAEVRCYVPEEARSDAWVSLDGQRIHRLGRSQSISMRMCEYPLPTVSKVDVTADWFDAISSAFHFNERATQKPLNQPPSS